MDRSGPFWPTINWPARPAPLSKTGYLSQPDPFQASPLGPRATRQPANLYIYFFPDFVCPLSLLLTSIQHCPLSLLVTSILNLNLVSLYFFITKNNNILVVSNKRIKSITNFNIQNLDDLITLCASNPSISKLPVFKVFTQIKKIFIYTNLN